MISVTILTKNSERDLANVLNALQRFDEVIVYDTGSTDTTVSLAEEFTNVKVRHGAFIGFGPTHNEATSHAKYDWILSIDSDEVVTPELVDEIFTLSLNPNNVYSIQRNNFYRNKFIKGCGWYPDRVVRLYNRKTTRFSDDLVHEKVLTSHLKEIPLRAPLRHYPYKTIDDFLRKMQSYSSLFASQNAGKKRGGLRQALLHGIAAFFKSYVLKRGIILGGVGLEISIYNGVTAYYKYLKLRDAKIVD